MALLSKPIPREQSTSRPAPARGLTFTVAYDVAKRVADVIPGGACGVRAPPRAVAAASTAASSEGDACNYSSSSSSGGSSSSSSSSSSSRASPRISTTVSDECGRRPLRIQTTIQQKGLTSQGRHSNSHQAASSSHQVNNEAMLPFLQKEPLLAVVAQKAERQTGEAKEREALARMAVEGTALMAMSIQAPLQMLSPWSGLAVMAAPPPMSPYQRQLNMMNPQLQKDEEQFAELIFPGFDANSFMWQVTCWQTAEFILSMWLGHQRANPTPCVLYRLGASWGPALARGQVWRLVTPVMLHANLTHLLFNVFFQLRMGFGMEKQFGREKMIMIYFACGIFGNLMSAANDPFKLAVGASTAGFGLIGVWLAEILLSWEILGPARERTILWIVFMLISVTTMSTMTPNMDLFGHLGGALGGFLLAILISDMREEDRPPWYSEAKLAAMMVMALLMTGASAKVFLGPQGPLPDCPLFQAMVGDSNIAAAAAQVAQAAATMKQ